MLRTVGMMAMKRGEDGSEDSGDDDSEDNGDDGSEDRGEDSVGVCVLKVSHPFF